MSYSCLILLCIVDFTASNKSASAIDTAVKANDADDKPAAAHIAMAIASLDVPGNSLLIYLL